MFNNKDSKIISFEDDGYEINITVKSIGESILEDNPSLKEVVNLAISKGFSRFVGTGGEYNEKREFIFIFSKPDYFDKDDGLVRNPAASVKIDQILKGSKKQRL